MTIMLDSVSTLARLRARIEELARDSLLPTSRKIAEQIWQEDRQLWVDWYEEHGDAARVAFVGDILRVIRLRVASDKPRAIFDFSYVIDDENHRKPLGEMVGKDLRFVASAYRERTRTMRARSNLFSALAKQAGVKRVREVFTEKQLADLFHQFGIQLEEEIGA